MSGIIGHTIYAILGAMAASERGLPVATIANRHLASFLAGAYLGCDVQTMPEAVCLESGQEVGYGTVPLAKSPISGGPVRPWSLSFHGSQYRPTQIHQQFYGRAHLIFGWTRIDQEHSIPWDHLPDYCAATVEDTMKLFGSGERQLAYLLGWMAHIVGDSLIKSVRDGLTLHLLDGKYTAKNRPIQDLVTFHEVGIKDLGLNWNALLSDLAETPVEPIQFHYMRVAEPRGQLARDFPHGWIPDKSELLRAVLAENRRYVKYHIATVLTELELRRVGNELDCGQLMKEASGGLTYIEMLDIADRAKFRHALWQMGIAVADLFQAVVDRVEVLRKMPRESSISWSQLGKKWRE